MSNGIVATKKANLVGNLNDVFIQLHLVIDHRTDLQQIKVPTSVIVQVDSKLDFHGTRHFFLSIIQHLPKQFGEREHPVLQHARK